MLNIYIVRNKCCILSTLLIFILLTGCVSERVNRQGDITIYQENLALKGPQPRVGTEGIDLIQPLEDPAIPELNETTDHNGKRSIDLTLENAVIRALVNSPEIKVVSFDPSIAKEKITAAVSEFDVAAFGKFQYDNNDAPTNDVSVSGISTSSLMEAGIKQKVITGAEWSLAYNLNHIDDNSVTRIFPKSYEPAMVFEFKQPLLQNAWQEVNLAGVHISKLAYRSAFESFRQQAESISAEVAFLYWNLFQSLRNIEIQKGLLEITNETLKTVMDRKELDATVGDIKQAEASVKSREAALLEAQNTKGNVQDRLVRLLADHQINLAEDIEIMPVTPPVKWAYPMQQSELIRAALQNNPVVSRAKLEAEIAEINMNVAKKQRLPQLDLVASAQFQGLSDSQGDAHDMMTGSEYGSYSVGLVIEYPLGNRSKKSEYNQKKLKHLKSLSNLQNLSDKVANLVKEKIRATETAQTEMKIQQEAVSAASIHLQSLEDVEKVREKLTPEFLLVKLQAQDSLADAQRANVKAIIDYNIAMTRLAEATGSVLDLRHIKQK